MRKTMIETGIKAVSEFKVCPQCQEYTKFSPNVYTGDGLNICCDVCYKNATVAHVTGKEFLSTQRTKEAFVNFQNDQRKLREAK